MTFYKIYGTKYLVRNLPDKHKAAEILHNISNNLDKLVNIVYQDCNECDKKESIQRLKNNFNKSSIIESSPNLGSEYTSYTVNKGTRIVMCIRTKDVKAELHDLNTLMFVAIHEIGHIMTKENGHPPIFWNNMAYLLKKAIENKLYVPQDFKNFPENYCGMEINNSPVSYDESVNLT